MQEWWASIFKSGEPLPYPKATNHRAASHCDMTPNTTTKVFLEDVVVLKAGLQARMPPPIKGHAETIPVRKQVRQAGEDQCRPAISENNWDSRGRQATWPQQVSLKVHTQHMRPLTLDLCDGGCPDDHRCMPDKCFAQRHLAQFLECETEDHRLATIVDLQLVARSKFIETHNQGPRMFDAGRMSPHSLSMWGAQNKEHGAYYHISPRPTISS
jgi:hypothetical protein